MSSSSKDRLKHNLNRGPLGTAQSQIIPDLSKETGTSNSADTNTDNSVDTDSVISVQLQLTKSDLAQAQKEVVESKDNLNRVQKELDSAKEDNNRLTSRVEELEGETAALKAQLEAARNEVEKGGSGSEPELTQLQSDLKTAQTEKEALQQQLASVTQQLESMRQAASSNSSTLVEDFAKARLMKQFGQKKGDTYKQTGFYQDNDIEERMAKYLKKARVDKSTVINAAIDHLLSLIGF